jgi:hypothetical protein
MPTNSEDIINNPSENLPDNNRFLSPQLTSDLRGVTYGLTYDKNNNIREPSSLAPTGLIFNPIPTYQSSDGSGISNGYASRVSGITDFKAYNNYVHYKSTTTGPGPQFNVYNALKKATLRFEIYSREYRI